MMSLRTFQFRWKEIRYDRELLDRELCMTTFKKLSEKLEAGPEVKVRTKTTRRSIQRLRLYDSDLNALSAL